MIEIDDEEMSQLGQRISYNEFLYNDKLYKIVRTHQTENFSYYIEIGK